MLCAGPTHHRGCHGRPCHLPHSGGHSSQASAAGEVLQRSLEAAECGPWAGQAAPLPRFTAVLPCQPRCVPVAPSPCLRDGHCDARPPTLCLAQTRDTASTCVDRTGYFWQENKIFYLQENAPFARKTNFSQGIKFQTWKSQAEDVGPVVRRSRVPCVPSRQPARWSAGGRRGCWARCPRPELRVRAGFDPAPLCLLGLDGRFEVC